MQKNKKLLILVNNLNFFLSHRLPIAEASIKKGFDVVVGYGELGGANHKIFEHKKTFKLITKLQIKRFCF